jgi:hypothetical protein
LGLAGKVTRLDRLAYPSFEKLLDGGFPRTLARRPRSSRGSEGDSYRLKDRDLGRSPNDDIT